jgi:hypothetical protein
VRTRASSGASRPPTVIGGGSTDQWWNSRTWRRTHRCIITTNDRAIAMTSERQIDANRRNAMKSTGPTAAKGKRRSSRSALRHGLSRPRWLEAQESAIAAKIAEFTQKLVGEDASPTEIALARAGSPACSSTSGDAACLPPARSGGGNVSINLRRNRIAG